MDLQSRKIVFVQEFLKVQSEELISKLEDLLRKESKSLLDDELRLMTAEDLNSRIDKSMEDSKSGRITKASDFKDRIDKWT